MRGDLRLLRTPPKKNTLIFLFLSSPPPPLQLSDDYNKTEDIQRHTHYLTVSHTMRSISPYTIQKKKRYFLKILDKICAEIFVFVHLVTV